MLAKICNSNYLLIGQTFGTVGGFEEELEKK